MPPIIATLAGVLSRTSHGSVMLPPTPGGDERLGGVGPVGDDQVQDVHHAAAGVVRRHVPSVVERIVHLAVIGQTELAVQLRRDHRVAGGAAAGLDQVELGALQRLLDEPQLLVQQDLHEPMRPSRGCRWPRGSDRRVHQAAGVLPAAGLIAPDEAAQDARVATRRTRPRRPPLSSICHGHVFVDELDVLVPLDQILGDPRRRRIAAGLVGRAAFGRGDGVMQHLVEGSSDDDLDLLQPLGTGRRTSRRSGIQNWPMASKYWIAASIPVLECGERSYRPCTCRDGIAATGGW